MDVTGILIACVILILLAICWFGFSYWANSPMENPDAEARITGNCGDTMEICLKFKNDRIEQTRCWTDGCSISKQCLEGAAMLARGKTLSELRNLNMIHIMDLVGHLPDTHVHCAQLAETTLQKALDNYLKHQPPALQKRS